MIFTCSKEILNEAVSIVSKAVSSKSNTPVLECILITAENHFIKLSGSDFDLAIESEMPAEVEEEGRIAVNARFFGDIIRKADGETVHMEADDECRIKIRCANTRIETTGMPGEEFPEIENIESEHSIIMKDTMLKSMIKQTLFAVGTDESKMILTGSLFEIKNNILNVVSLDRFRLALRRETLESETDDVSFVIPSKALSEINKIIKDEDIDVNIGVSDNKVQFEIGCYKIISRLLEGEFLDYNQILPKESKIYVTADVKPLCDAIERAALIIENETTKYPVKLSIETDRINLSCVSRVGKMDDTVFVETKGDNLEIGFNYRFLLEALKACECEKVSIEFNTMLNPCIIKPVEGDKFIYIVLPVKMRG